MGIVLSRLRRGEIIAGASAVLMLVFMFALPWYEERTPLGLDTFNGWDGITHVRWLLVVTIAVALALVYFQATRPAPAIPVTLSVILTVLALLSTVVLIYKVLINVPGPDAYVHVKVGAYLGLASALTMLYGAFLSMREEGISPRDAPTEIETIRPQGSGGS
jgi:hypothetical protein